MVKNQSNVASKTKQKFTAHERIHAEDELIFLYNFPFDELIPNWQNFDPNTKNPAIDSNYSKGHHCPARNGKKFGDFTRFALAICLEWEQNPVTREWGRCYNQFTTDSDQCRIHNKRQYKDGPNQIYRLMKTNRVGNWGMLKNPAPGCAGAEATVCWTERRDLGREDG
jgi:hypothetical protein